MLIKKTNIDICIATYKRVCGLASLLDTLTSQNLDANINIRIIIIDNDPEKSAQSLVEVFFSNNVIPYVYDMQPEKNIALTRNKALDYVEAEYIVFVDDDEWVTSNWLNNLMSASQQYDADVVFGQVIPELPIDASNWVRKGGFFNDGASKTGDLRQHGATNNTLVRISAKIKPLLHFDPEYGLTGGSDTELFNRLYIDGAKLIWCNDAPVYEIVPYDRMTTSWLMKRAFRGGQVYARIFYKNQPLYKIIIQFIKRSAYLFIGCALFPFALVIGKSRWVLVLRKIVANTGQLSMLFTNKSYQEYK